MNFQCRPRPARHCFAWLVLLCLLLRSLTAWGGQESDFRFVIEGNGAVLTGYTGPGGAVVIPDRLGGRPVVSIVDYAFSGCTSLTSMSIPNSVTSIGDSAFSNCTSLTSVTIPNSVTSIGDSTFSSCTSLTSVTIPNSVTSIGDSASFRGGSAFSDCTSLTSIAVDELNPAYSSADGVLFNKTQSALLAYPAGKAGPYVIPNSVTTIGGGAFSGCTSLTSVTIPHSVTSIRVDAFSGCTSLTSLALPHSVTGIGWAAFSGCTSLTSITLPNRVTHIGRYTFSGCTSLTSVALPNSVTVIDWNAFRGCTSLTGMTIPNSVTYIGASAFSGCTSLTSAYFEGNAPATGGDAFSGSDFVTVFHRSGAFGWGSSFDDRPTAVWRPRPTFEDWAVSTGLTAQFPNAVAQSDDPDGDGFTNGAEWFAATDPTQRASRLELELTPRPADLSASDQTPIEPGQHAVYLRSVPGRY